MSHTIPLPDIATRFEGAAKVIDLFPALPAEKHEAMWRLTLALDEAGFVIARVHPSNVMPLPLRRTAQDLTPCDVDPSPETAA